MTRQLAHLTLTWVTYVWSLVVVGVVSPLLVADLGVGIALAGTHLAAFATGQVLVGFVAARVVRGWGHRRTLVTALAALATSAAGLTGAPWVLSGPVALTLSLPAVALAGGAGALVVTVVTVTVHTSEGPRAGVVLSRVHAWSAAAALVAPLVVGAGIAAGLGWAPGVLLVVPLALAAVLSGRSPAQPTPPRLPAPRRSPETVSAPGATATAETAAAETPHPMGLRVWTVALVVLCGVALELAVLTWSASLVADHTDLSVASGAAAVSAVVAGIAVGRAGCAALLRRLSAPSLLLCGVGVLILGLVGLAGATAPPVASGAAAIAALAVTGLGIAALYPLGTAWLTDLAGERAAAAMARVAVGSGVALGGAPLVLGAIAAVTGVRVAAVLVLAPLVAVLLTALVALIRAQNAVPARHLAPPSGVWPRRRPTQPIDLPGELRVSSPQSAAVIDQPSTAPRPVLPAAVLLDMDGTLLDGEPIWEEAIRAHLAAHDVPWSAADQHRHVGNPIADNVLDLVAHARRHGVELPGHPADIEEALVAAVQARLAVDPPWRPGALELVLDLQDWSMPLAMVTSSPRRLAGPVAAAAGIETLVTIDDVECPKPHPEPYRRAAERLGVDSADCVAVEDSGTGLRSALAAGCVVVHVPQDGDVPLEDQSHLGVQWRPSLVGVGWIELVDVMSGRDRRAELAGATP